MEKFELIKYVPAQNTKNLCTYGCGGNVKGAFYPKDEHELIGVYNYLKVNALPFKIVGNGSNLLFSPKSKDIYVISMKNMKAKAVFKNERVTFNSAISLPLLSKMCYEKGLGGMAELSGIPATMGGAIKMNAGAFGRCIFDMLERVRVIKNGRVKTLFAKEIYHSYHHTSLDDELILGGTLILKNQSKCEIMKRTTECMEKRIKSQPSGKCCGSVFANPKDESAGRLIEKCGLKGISKNGGEISQKHGNFIINKNDATFQDIMDLINICEDFVYHKFNIKLIREVEII